MTSIKKLFQNNTVVLILVFIVLEVIANPLGEFSLNDDWSYAKSVETLSLYHTYDIGFWPAMTLLSHVLWGFLFVKLFGFSFTVLRLSVITLSLVTLLVSEKLIFNLTSNKRTALYASLLLLVNPLFFSLSNTYMTDVTFLCFCVLSFYFYQRFFSSDKNSYLVFAFLFSLLAVFTRQLAIAIPVAFVMVSFLSLFFKKSNRIFPFAFSVCALLLTILLIYRYEAWIFKTMVDWASYQGIFFSKKKLEFSFPAFFDALESRTGLFLLYTGLFLFPIVISRSPGILKNFFSSKTWPGLIFLGLAAYLVYLTIGIFPFGNVLYNCGLGIETTIDTLQLQTNLLHAKSDLFLMTLKIVSILGLALFILRVFTINRFISLKHLTNENNPFPLFISIVLILYTVLVCVSPSIFDRYALFFSYTCMVLFFIKTKPDDPVKRISYIPLLIIALFSVFSTKDYFNYNRKKEEAISFLKNDLKVSPEKIHGGFEYFMWNYYKDGIGYPMWDKKDSEYLVTVGAVSNYHPVAHFPYQRLIPFQKDTLFVLEKNAP